MGRGINTQHHGALRTYRVVLKDDAQGAARTVEFEAQGPEAALLFVGQHCPGRLAELIENGRSLGFIRNDRDSGYWTIGGGPGAASLAA